MTQYEIDRGILHVTHNYRVEEALQVRNHELAAIQRQFECDEMLLKIGSQLKIERTNGLMFKVVLAWVLMMTASTVLALSLWKMLSLWVVMGQL